MCLTAIIKCPCASSRWEVLWHLYTEFQSESELHTAMHTEEEGEDKGWWEEKEVVEEE